MSSIEVTNDPVEYAIMALRIAHSGKQHWPTLVTALEQLLDRVEPKWREKLGAEAKVPANEPVAELEARVVTYKERIDWLVARLGELGETIARYEQRSEVERARQRLDSAGDRRDWDGADRAEADLERAMAMEPAFFATPADVGDVDLLRWNHGPWHRVAPWRELSVARTLCGMRVPKGFEAPRFEPLEGRACTECGVIADWEERK